MIWLPDHGVGAVILINSDTGAVLRSAFRRRLLEVLFDGETTASEFLLSNARAWRAGAAEQSDALDIAAGPDAVGALAPRYRSPELGVLEVSRRGGQLWFDFGGWRSAVARRQSETGAMSLVTISPSLDGFEFEIADAGASRRLIIREGERAYVFTAEP
jgi:hypothetical protein